MSYSQRREADVVSAPTGPVYVLQVHTYLYVCLKTFSAAVSIFALLDYNTNGIILDVFFTDHRRWQQLPRHLHLIIGLKGRRVYQLLTSMIEREIHLSVTCNTDYVTPMCDILSRSQICRVVFF